MFFINTCKTFGSVCIYKTESVGNDTLFIEALELPNVIVVNENKCNVLPTTKSYREKLRQSETT